MVPSAPAALPPMTAMPLLAVTVPDFVRPPVPVMNELIERAPVVAHWLMIKSLVPAVIVPPVMTCAAAAFVGVTKMPPEPKVRVFAAVIVKVDAVATLKRRLLTVWVVQLAVFV